MGMAFDFNQQVLLRTEIEQIMLLGYDFLNADKMGDTTRRNRIFKILITVAKKKQGWSSLQTYFGGKRIGHFRNTITDAKARDYVFTIIEEARGLNDWRVKPQAFSEVEGEGPVDEELELEDIRPEDYPEGTFELEG